MAVVPPNSERLSLVQSVSYQSVTPSQPLREETEIGSVKYVVVQQEPRHPYFHSTCCVAGCVPTGVFGSFATPYIPVGGKAAGAAIGKYLGGAIGGSVLGTFCLGYGLYKVYYRLYPDQEKSAPPVTQHVTGTVQ